MWCFVPETVEEIPHRADALLLDTIHAACSLLLHGDQLCFPQDLQVLRDGRTADGESFAYMYNR